MSGADPMDPAASLKPSPDATEAFLAIYRELAVLGEHHARKSLPQACYETDFLLVPGLLTRWNVGYMTPNLERLASLGLEARLTWAVHPMDSIERNAQALRRELESHTRPLVVLAHSKGALDLWCALARWPELVPKLRAFVALQSPVFGSEVADWYRGHAFRRFAVRVGAKVFRGSEDAVWDLTTETRTAFVQAHPFPVERIPTWSLVSTFTRPLHRYYVGRFAMAEQNAGPNDGMVSPRRGVIPGSRRVELADMDHLDPFTTSDGIEQFTASTTYDAATLTETLVRLVFAG